MMNKVMTAVALAAAACVATAVQAAPTVDGAYDAEYGAAKSTVGYDANAPISNFGAPTANSNAIGYSIFLTSDTNNVYGFLQTSGPGAAVDSFANLYFGYGSGGSVLGFEIGRNGVNAFYPNTGQKVALGSNVYSTAFTANSVEFSLSNTLFTAPITGLNAPTYSTTSPTTTLRLSQSFGYSVAGGASYGTDRLGTVGIAAAVPEPATWAMMLVGFAMVGAAARRRRTVTRAALA